MARNETTRSKQRVQVEAPTNTGGLDVNAPMDVRVAPANQGFAQLQSALMGVAAPLAKAKKEKDDAEAVTQGQADQKFNKVDQARMARQEKYADGVFEARVTTETAAAIADVEERAATELPPDTSVEDKLAWVDAQLQAELGGLTDDPKARRIIHAQYADYMEKFAGRETAVARETNRQEVLAAYDVEIDRMVEGADVDVGDLVNRMSAVIPRTEAWRFVADKVAQRAEAMNDYTVISDLLPDRVTTEDGQTIDSPIRTTAIKERLQLARSRIDKNIAEKVKPLREYKYSLVLDNFKQRIRDGHPIGMTETQQFVESGDMTADTAASLRDQSLKAFEDKQKKADDAKVRLNALKRTSTGAWIDTEGDPEGSENRAESQKLVDGTIQDLMAGYAEHHGKAPAMSGEEIASDPATLKLALDASAQQRLPSTAIKSYLAELNPGMGGTVLKRLPIYAEVKARGLSSMYLSPESEAQLELALVAQRAGEKEESIPALLQRVADPSQHKTIMDNREKTHKLVLKGEVDVVNRWADPERKTVANMSMVKARLGELADLYASYDVPAEQAAQMAQERFDNTHFAVSLNGGTYVLPESTDYDPSVAAAALESFSAAAPKLATAAGDPNPEGAEMRISFGVGGRAPVAQFYGSNGLPLDGKTYSLPNLIKGMNSRDPSGQKAAAAKHRAAQQSRRNATVRRRAAEASGAAPIQPRF